MTTALAERKLQLSLSRTQERFCFDGHRFSAFIGGRGSGKSYAGAAKAMVQGHLSKSGLGIVVAPTFGMLRDASWRTALEIWAPLIAEVNRSDMRLQLRTGHEVLFRSADDPDRLRGPTAHWAWIDEGAQCDRETWPILLGTLRGGGHSCPAWVTTTPYGMNWIYEVFVQNATDDTVLYRASSAANPFLDDGYVKMLRQQYGSAFGQQEIEGQFIQLGAGMFRREWFEIVDAFPAEARRVRHWDLAATEATKGKGEDPDWTAGALLAEKDGQYWLCDMRRIRATPQNVERLIRQTAETDGRAVHIWMEQEPGSAGVNTIDHYARTVLRGFTFRGQRATGKKAERAAPVSAAAEAGNVKLVRGAWMKDFLDEVDMFPGGAHDDQIDALSAAFERLQRRGDPFAHVVLQGAVS